MGAGLKYNPTGYSFQLGQIAAQLPMVGDGLLHGLELRGGQRHSDGFARHFAGPLVAGAAGAPGAVLNGALTEVSPPGPAGGGAAQIAAADPPTRSLFSAWRSF